MKKRLISAVFAAMLTVASISPAIPAVSADDQFEETVMSVEEAAEPAAEEYAAEEIYEEAAFEDISEETSEEISDFADETEVVADYAAPEVEEETVMPDTAPDDVEEEVQTSVSESEYTDEAVEKMELITDYADETTDASEQGTEAAEVISVEESVDAAEEPALSEASVENHLVCYVDNNHSATEKNIDITKGPLTLKAYPKADNMDGIRYSWGDNDFNDFGTKSEATLTAEYINQMMPGERNRIFCRVEDKYGNYAFGEFYIMLKPRLALDQNDLKLGLVKSCIINATMAGSDRIAKIVPVNKNVATATCLGSKIIVKTGKTGGSTNIAVKTASGKVVKFKVTVPKPVLSFTSGGKTLTLKNGLSVNKGKSAAVAVKLANGDSIAKISPSNSKVSCSWFGNRITVKGGKTAGTVNVAVKTKCGKVAKFKVVVK